MLIFVKRWNNRFKISPNSINEVQVFNVDLAAATSSEVASTLVKRDGTGSANFETVGLGILSFNAVVNGPTVQCAGFASGGENILIPDPGVCNFTFCIRSRCINYRGTKNF